MSNDHERAEAPERGASRGGATDQAATGPTQALGAPGALLALQGLAGNRAVGHLLRGKSSDRLRRRCSARAPRIANWPGPG